MQCVFHWGSSTIPDRWTAWPPAQGTYKTFVVSDGHFSWLEKVLRIGLFSNVSEVGYVDTGPIHVSFRLEQRVVSMDDVDLDVVVNITLMAKNQTSELKRIADARNAVCGLVEAACNLALGLAMKHFDIDEIHTNSEQIQVAVRESLQFHVAASTPYDAVSASANIEAKDEELTYSRQVVTRYKKKAVERRIEIESIEAQHQADLARVRSEGRLSLAEAKAAAQVELISVNMKKLKAMADLSFEIKRKDQEGRLEARRLKEALSIVNSVDDLLAINSPSQFWDFKIAQAKSQTQLARAAGQLADLTNLMQGEKAGLLAATMRSQLITLEQTMREIGEQAEDQNAKKATPSD